MLILDKLQSPTKFLISSNIVIRKQFLHSEDNRRVHLTISASKGNQKKQ